MGLNYVLANTSNVFGKEKVGFCNSNIIYLLQNFWFMANNPGRQKQREKSHKEDKLFDFC